MNLPNSLTLTRIFLVPLLVVVLLTEFEDRLVLGMRKDLLGAAIFALGSLTDWLDGFLARRRQQVTTLGQWIDPLADKLLVSAALISLVQMGLVAAWMAAVIIGREFVVTGLRSLAHNRGVALPASGLGKTKMSIEVAAILLLILGHGYSRVLVVAGQLALWIVLVTAVTSAADYYRRFSRLSSPKVADIAVARRRAAEKKRATASGTPR